MRRGHAARRPLHGGSRSLLQRHDRLRGLHFARDDVSGTHRHSGRLRTLLRAALEASHRAARRSAIQRVAVFGHLRNAWDSPKHVSATRPKQIIRAGARHIGRGWPLDQSGHGAHHVRRPEARGAYSAGFHRDPEGQPFLPISLRNLPTPSGKIEFFSETLAAQGLDGAARVSSRPSNHAGGRTRSVFRWNS